MGCLGLATTRGCILLVICAQCIVARAVPQTSVSPSEQYTTAIAELERFIQHEMADKRLPALSIALVDGQHIVWAKGFGFADSVAKRPATAATIYRVGPLSTLFTTIAVMQQVKKGKLQLDAPIATYLPRFRVENPFGHELITLRELLSQRSGLAREPPRGYSSDPTTSSLATTIQSLQGTRVVYPPGEYTKCSDAGVATAGYVLERLAREPFAQFVARAVLKPAAMNSTTFELSVGTQRELAKGSILTYHGRRIEGPTFQMGVSPSVGMYSSVLDLGRFITVAFASDQGSKLDIDLQALAPDVEQTNDVFLDCVAFRRSSLARHAVLSNIGTIDGFTAGMELVPDAKMGIVIATTMGGANGVVSHIAHEGLRLALAVRSQEATEPIPITHPIAREQCLRLAGRYGDEDNAVDLVEQEGELFVLPVRGGYMERLRELGSEIVVDDKSSYGMRITPLHDAIQINGKVLSRAKLLPPAPIPTEWTGLIGEYGPKFHILYILEKDGHLTSLDDWYEYAPLHQLSSDTYVYSHRGNYDGEKLTFKRDKDGFATEVLVEGVVFRRRPVGRQGTVFRIHPLRPVQQLKYEALKDTPPRVESSRPSDLVNLTTLDPTIKFDIRYATTNDFLSTPVYDQPIAYMQRPAAEALLRVHKSLQALGYGLLIFDGYRPWYVTKIFWEATPKDKRIFVADPVQGSRHNRGCAVDLTLYDLKTGKPMDMVSVYDEMSDRAFPFYPGGTSRERWNRNLLRSAMEVEGFQVYDTEWWHFDYRDWQFYPIGNDTFEQLKPDRLRAKPVQ
jgi:D-alanyl-D-alanine dipeptidase/CubicO group peptidase (beta-lactamase class C family)